MEGPNSDSTGNTATTHMYHILHLYNKIDNCKTYLRMYIATMGNIVMISMIITQYCDFELSIMIKIDNIRLNLKSMLKQR